MSERINHYHVCSKMHIFGHDIPGDDISDEEYHARHNCPICGENVRDVIGYPNDEEMRRRDADNAKKYMEFLQQFMRR